MALPLKCTFYVTTTTTTTPPLYRPPLRALLAVAEAVLDLKQHIVWQISESDIARVKQVYLPLKHARKVMMMPEVPVQVRAPPRALGSLGQFTLGSGMNYPPHTHIHTRCGCTRQRRRVMGGLGIRDCRSSPRGLR